MSKYIVEIKPEYEDTTKGVMVLGARESNLYVDTLSIENLEELNSDYINEHFGDLQDEAYKRGFEDGKKEAESSDHIKNVEMDAFNKGMLFKEEKISEAYQRGFEDGKAQSERGCEGCRFEETICTACENCCNSHMNHWTAKDDEIKVGDEVIYNGTTKCLVVRPETDKRYAVLIDGNGYHHSADHRECKKTGRHFDIDKILAEMRT